MIVKNYSTRRFAGLKDKELEFGDGLNVILGPNEAGKSTIVEGIHSVLFKKSRLLKRDSDFIDRYMPLPDGDSIDGTVVLNHDGKDYTLKKEWGEAYSTELEKPSGDVIKNEDEIQNELNSIFKFGQGTYSSLFFAKQTDVKNAIQNIIKNEEETSEVSTLLRKTIMELDGISIEKLGNKIDGEIKEYFNNWDIERNSPKNNRGISNPYKIGIGKILQSFYDKEGIKLEMNKANSAEDEFEKARKALEDAEKSIKELKSKKESMEALEEDVTQRLVLEPKLESLSKELASLSKINEQWPQNKMRLTQLEEELNKINTTIEELNKEKEQAKLLTEKESLEKTLKDIDYLKTQIDDIKNQISKVNNITKEDIAQLEKNYNEMLKTEAMINAGMIIGQLNYYDGKKPLMIAKDLDEATPVEVGGEFKANGYMKLESQGLFQIELKTGEQDFNALREKYEEYKNSYNETLERLKVTSVAEAKTNHEEVDNLNRKLNSSSDRVDHLLGDYTYDELKSKIDSFGDLSAVRSLNIIESDIIRLNNNKTEKLSEKRLCEMNISNWEEIYKDTSGLFNKVASTMSEKNNIEEKMNSLKPLPEEFKTSEDFRKTLAIIRAKYDSSQENIKGLSDNFNRCQRELPEVTYEELVSDYEDLTKEFNKNLEKGNRLLKIKEAFNFTREKMDENSFEPVINTFAEYIEILTDGSYKSTEIGDGFNIRVCKEDELAMPIDLLSSGTYDSIALAFRLSILEHILGDYKGFVILDDCLVDLDPDRKEMAVKLINKFAENHQVIFTTCSPDTAKELGGNLITM